MKILLVALALLAQVAAAQQRQAAIPPGPEVHPGRWGTPRMTFPPSSLSARSGHRRGAAMVICPGGATCIWPNWKGITTPAGSASRASPVSCSGAPRLRRIAASGNVAGCDRADAHGARPGGQWQLDPQRVGIIGSSAGGHLASTLLTHFDAGQPDAADPIERTAHDPISAFSVIRDQPGQRVHPSRIQTQSARDESTARLGAGTLQRFTGHQRHPAVFRVAPGRRSRCTGGKLAAVRRRPAPARRPV